MIGVIYPDSGWILGTIAKRMCEAMPEVFSPVPLVPRRGSPMQYFATERTIDEFSAFYYVDVQNCYMPGMVEAFPEVKHVGMFTHLDRDADDAFRPWWNQLDGIVHMANRYAWRFASRKWYAAEQMITLRPGEVADTPMEPLRLGIVQRGGHVGKGSEFVPAVLKALPERFKPHIELHVCGADWPVQVMTCTVWEGVWVTPYLEESYASMPQRYDYLWIPSLWEGGPMALLEALAAGKPVIAPRVGWVEDFLSKLHHGDDDPEIHWVEYAVGDAWSCVKAISDIIEARLSRRRLVQGMSYFNYAGFVRQFIEQLEVKR